MKGRFDEAFKILKKISSANDKSLPDHKVWDSIITKIKPDVRLLKYISFSFYS